MVIGGSGFIGSETIKILAKHGIETISYDIIQSSSINENNKWIKGDILELPSIQKAIFEYQVDTILHLVGLPVVESCENSPHFSFLLNVVSVQNTLEAMRMTNVKKIVFASSALVYGALQTEPIKETDSTRPNTIYGYHKLIAEQIIKSYSQSYGIDYVILRLFNVYGADPHLGKDVISVFIRKALQGEPLVVKGPRKFRDFIHVSDVAQALLKAQTSINASNTVLNIGSGTKTSLDQLAKIVKTHFPKAEIKEEAAPDDGTGLQADISLAKQTLGFAPTRPEEAINAYIATYARNQHIKA